MLSSRLTLGIILIAALAGVCWLDFHAPQPGMYLLPLAVLLALAAVAELLTIWQTRPDGAAPLPWVAYGGALLTTLLAGAPVWMPARWLASSSMGHLGWLAVGLVASLLLAACGELRRYARPGPATTNLALSCLAIFYVGGLMGCLVQLRLLGYGSSADGARYGMLALVSLIAVVKLSDIGQYTAGRLFGARKLAPTISPGKTWEGVIGGMLFAIVGGLLSIWIGRMMGVDLPSGLKPTGVVNGASFLLYSLTVATFGIFGDLTESLLKRDAGVKDSSTWLPGFGGVLDILDSLLGAAPIAFVYWAVIF